jgi:hypothetical protein
MNNDISTHGIKRLIFVVETCFIFFEAKLTYIYYLDERSLYRVNLLTKVASGTSLYKVSIENLRITGLDKNLLSFLKPKRLLPLKQHSTLLF